MTRILPAFLLSFSVLGSASLGQSPREIRKWEWRKDAQPVISPGFAGDLDRKTTRGPCVLDLGNGTYRMYYTCGDDRGRLSICAATAEVADPRRWTPHAANPVFEPAGGNVFDNRGVDFANVVRVSEKTWYMYYTGWGTWARSGRISNRTGLAVSDDGGLTWRRHSRDPILELGPSGTWDSDLSGSVFVVKDPEGWRMWYTAGRYYLDGSQEKLDIQIGLGRSSDGIRWEKHAGNPVMPSRKSNADPFEYVVSKPYVVREGGLYRLWYSHRGIGYRIGYGESRDGIHWDRWYDRAGIEVSPQGWDSQIIEYACVLPHGAGYRLWFCGNGFGATGIGYAETPPQTLP